jgi:hypothetical protein
MNPAAIGRYKVMERLGQGGMGSLYLAHDPVIDRMLAIKVLREGLDNDELRARFAREARAAGRLSHPNIVTIFDVGEFDNQPFIAMEYVPGETLEGLIRRRVRMPLERKIKLLEELCEGLAYAHRTGLVHRDIKPANLMVTGEGTLKILDFGIVRIAESGMTQTGMLVGTLPYMSPEQVDGKQVDHRSDIFAVGDVVYELLTYRQAFPGGVKDGVFDRILRSEPPALEELCPDVPEDLPPIVSRALAKDPESRYQDLAAMRADLARVRQRLHQLEAGAGPARSEDATIVAGRGRRGPGTSAGPATPAPGGARESVTKRRAALIQAHLAAAERALEEGDSDKALAEAEGAALLDPYDQRAQAIVDRATDAIEEREVQRCLTEARDHLARGEPTLAAGLVEQALKTRPASQDALAVQRSVDDLRRELELARERAQIVRQAIERSRAALATEAFDVAIRAADEALARQPEQPEALELKREATARRDERRRIDEHERAAEGAVAEARNAFRQARHDEALAALERFAPPHPLVSQTLGELRQELEAIRQREVEAQRQKVAALTAAARQAADSGRYDEAHGLAARIRELEPESGAATALIRDIASRKAAAEEAARRKTLAAEAARRAAEAFDRRDLAGASREIEQVLEFDATHDGALALRRTVKERQQVASAHRQAAAAALSASDPVTARAQLDQASEIEPGAPDIETLESGLAALRQRLETEERQRLERERRELERQEAERQARELRERAEQLALKQKEEAERRARAQREEEERRAREQREEAERRAREQKEEAERLAREQKEKAERQAREQKEQAERQARDQKIDKAVGKARRKSSPAAALALLRPALELNPAREDVVALIREYEAAEAAALTAGAATPSQETTVRSGSTFGPAHAAAAVAVMLALSVGGWLLMGHNRGPVPTAVQPPAAQPEVGAAGPTNPPPTRPEAPATTSSSSPSATPVPGAAPGVEAPALTEPVRAETAAVEKELAPFRARARRELASGQHANALATVQRGLKVRADDPDMRRMLDAIIQNARTQAAAARTDATAANAPRFAAGTFDRGVEQERAAEKEQEARRTEPAVRGFWSARDTFAQAAGEARTASGEEDRRQLAAAEAERKRQEAAAAEKSKPPGPPAGGTSTPAATTTPPPVVEQPPTTGRSSPVVPDPRPAITQTLKAYEAAYAAMDIDALRRVMVLSDDETRRLRGTFADASKYSVSVRVEAIIPAPDGRRATVNCVVSRAISARGGGQPPRVPPTPTVFTLEQRGAGWVITSTKTR